MITSHRRYQKNPGIVDRRIGGEFILVPIRHNAGDMNYIYSLNEVGGYIWDTLDGNRDLGEIAALVAQEYEVSLDEAEADAREFLGQMEAIEAVIPVGEGS